jgi:hypothetical protein
MTRIHILCHVLLVFNIFLIFLKNFFNLLIILNYIILLHSGWYLIFFKTSFSNIFMFLKKYLKKYFFSLLNNALTFF